MRSIYEEYRKLYPLAQSRLEALQHYRRSHEEGSALPTVLVLEEAHTFAKRTREEDGAVLSSVHLCRETFEKIAREGRKFGLGLVLSSQRPSELSPTVLAQCNTFLLHRLVNDADQNLVARLVHDNVGALLRELPSLPSKQAILLGWATPIPVLLEVGELDKEHQLCPLTQTFGTSGPAPSPGPLTGLASQEAGLQKPNEF